MSKSVFVAMTLKQVALFTARIVIKNYNGIFLVSWASGPRNGEWSLTQISVKGCYLGSRPGQDHHSERKGNVVEQRNLGEQCLLKVRLSSESR